MKILHIESGMHLYGGALQVVFLLRGLQQRGVQNVLVCPQGSAIAAAAKPYAQVIEQTMRGDVDVAMVARLRRVMRVEQPDLVHLHSRRGADTWGALAARSLRIPVILSRRVDNPESPWVVRLKYPLYQRVVTISQGIRQVLLQEGVPEQQLSCVPSAVDTQQYHPSATEYEWFLQEFQIAPYHATIGMVAQFIERKGHQVLLAALPTVLAAHPHTKILLFGQGPLHAHIQDQVRNSAILSRHVSLPGFRSDLDRILPNLSLLAHPAYMEGLGVSLLQAAACGIPIVATQAGGIPEVVEHEANGLLVPPGDAPALAHALDRLLSDPLLRQQYGQAGRQRMEQRFSIEAMVQGNLQVYQQTLQALRA